MDILLFSFQSIMPIVLPMFLGYVIRLLHMVDQKSFQQFNTMIFKTLLPLMIFMNIYHSEIKKGINWSAVIYALAAILLLFFLAWPTVACTVKNRAYRGIIIQGLFRANFVLFGLPLVMLLLPGKPSGLTELLIALVIPLFNVLAVFILQYYIGQKVTMKQLSIQILKNPLILGCAAGILVKLSNLEIPVFLEGGLSSLAKIASPLALLVLGGQFYFSSTARYQSYLIPILFLRLLAIPFVFLGTAVLLGFRGEALICFLAIFASPVAVSSYTMAQQMCPDSSELAGQILVYTSVFCIFSLFAFIAVGRAMAWI